MKSTTKSRRTTAANPTPREPTEAEIQHTAHQLWLAEGCPEGRELDHWFAAKERLLHQLHQSGPAATRGQHPATETLHFPSADQPTGPTSPHIHP
jgi:hypothetical protein